MCSNKETATEAVTPYNASAPSRIYPAAVCPRIKCLQWTDEEDVIVLKIRDEDSCLWEEITKAPLLLPHRTLEVIQQYYYVIRAGVGEADVSGG
jgi:hypothetical protein